MLACLSAGRPVFAEDAADAPLRRYGEPRQRCELKCKLINESSGLAVGWRGVGAEDRVFWTHNDSGDSAKLYAFDADGDDLATISIDGAEAVDWEDMASFKVDGRSWLLAADVGDNFAGRKACTLYLIEEPDLADAAPGKPRVGSVKPAATISFTYDDGPRDCESIAVDVKGKSILLISKLREPVSHVYELPLLVQSPQKAQTAQRIAALPLLMPTAMDISADGRRAIVLTYKDAYEFARRDGETWQQAFARTPREVRMPKRPQGESICYGRDGWRLYLTNEGKTAWLFEVPAGEE